MGNLLGGIFNFECGGHAIACRWWVTTGSVETIDALEVASCAIDSSELEPCDGTISRISLSLNRACWSRHTASLAAWQRSNLLLRSVEVEKGDTGVGEVVNTRDLKVGGVGCCGVDA